MADRYFKLATGNNNWSSTGVWCTLADGSDPGASVPTSAQSVAPSSSVAAGATLTVDATANCSDLDFTGAANTPTIAVTNAIQCYGNLTLIAAMTTNGLQNITMRATSGTKTITSNSHVWGCGLTISGAGGTFQLVDALHIAKASDATASSLALNAGVFQSQGFAILVDGAGSASIGLGTSSTRTTDITNSTVTCKVWGASTATATGLTMTTTGSTIVITSANFYGVNQTYNNVQFTNTDHTIFGSSTFANIDRVPATGAITDSFTFAAGTTQTITGTLTITSKAVNQKILVKSDTLGSAATINAAAIAITNGVALMDITGAGAASWDLSAVDGLSSDCKGNSVNIIFTTATSPNTYTGGTGNYSTAGSWSAGHAPLAQDDVTINTTGITVTVDVARLGRSVTFTGTGTVSVSNDFTVFGSFAFPSGSTLTLGGKSIIFGGRSNYTWTSGSKNWSAVVVNAPSGMVTLLDNTGASPTGALSINAGTFSVNGKTMYANTLQVTGAIQRNLTLTGGTLTLVVTTAGISKVNFSGSNYSIDGTGTIILTNSTANAQTFAGGGLTYNNVQVQGAGNYALTVTGSNIFNTIYVDASQAAKSVTFTDGTTTTLFDLKRDPQATNTVTINGTSTGGYTLTKTGGGLIHLIKVAISYATCLPVSTWFIDTVASTQSNCTNIYSFLDKEYSLFRSNKDLSLIDKLSVPLIGLKRMTLFRDDS